MTKKTYHQDGDYVREIIDTGAQVAEIIGHIPDRHLRVSLEDGSLINDGSDTETITVEVVSGLDVVRGDEPSLVGEEDDDGNFVGENHTATLVIDGAEVSVDITDSVGTKQITTTKDAGSIIDVQATGLADVPADESDTKEIEVTSA